MGNEDFPFEIYIVQGSVSLQGVASTKESLMGALRKISLDINEIHSSKNSDFTEIDKVLSEWQAGGGGFSGGGATGNW